MTGNVNVRTAFRLRGSVASTQTRTAFVTDCLGRSGPALLKCCAHTQRATTCSADARTRQQEFCAANQGDARCIIGHTNSFHKRCAKMRGKPLPTLLAPTALGLRVGFQGSFYYFKKHMDHDPNLSSREPDARRTSETIDFSAIEDFEIVAADFPPNYFAAIWQGVIRVERAGQYTFSTISEDGSHLWVDSFMVVDNGGMHGVQKVSSSMRLSRGYHEVRADFFKNSGGAVMVVNWKGPDTLEKEETLSAFHFDSVGIEPLEVPRVTAGGSSSDDDLNRSDNESGGEGTDPFSHAGQEPEAEPLPSPAAAGMQSGFLGQFFLLGEKMESMPNTAMMIPDFSYVAQNIDLTTSSDFEGIDQGKVPDYLAAVWTGVVVVETAGECFAHSIAYQFFSAPSFCDSMCLNLCHPLHCLGLYHFAVTSHDGSRLFIDGEQVVVNGGIQPSLQATGAVRLGRGYHSLRADYFKNEGGGIMSVEWNGPDTLHQDELLDGFHFKSSRPAERRKRREGNDDDDHHAHGVDDVAAGVDRTEGAAERAHSRPDVAAGAGQNQIAGAAGTWHTDSAGSEPLRGPPGSGAEGSSGGDTGRRKSDDALQIPKVDNKALGVPQPLPPAASHPPPRIPYDSPSRYDKTHEEGPTEDPFHLRQVMNCRLVGEQG